MGSAREIGWGIIGPGTIARAFAAGVARSGNGRVVALGTRDPKRPALAEHFPRVPAMSPDALLADPAVEAVYIATPHPSHGAWAIRAAEAGKHVLVEKPLAMTAWEADAAFHAARRAGTFMGEAFMYRVHPQTAKLVELVAGGVIGEVRAIKSSFGFAMPAFDPAHRLYANDLAGGGILDVGCYPVSMARLVAGAAAGRPFLDPVKVAGAAHLGPTGVDEWAAAILTFPGGILAEVSCSISLDQDNMLRILGTGGRIEVKDFWFASGKEGGTGVIEVIGRDGTTRVVEVAEDRWLYAFEAEAAGAAILAGRQEFTAPGMTWDDTLGNMRVLDAWRAGAGLTYGFERAEARPHTARGTPLAKGTAIPRREIPGLAKPASVLAMGFEDTTTFPGASIMLDGFFERGGNLYDTGWVYGGGRTDAVLGEWLRARGVRDEVVIIGKGAHSPLTYPDVIARQLAETLERLGTDHVDVYFMHRDNPEVPVGEFVDAMDAEAAAGRIRGPFGGSNWTRARFDEAVAYARRTGRRAPTVLSNNFSLAEMNDPIWDGCVAASDAEWRQWLAERGVVDFAWSSQGRGFFTDIAGRDRPGTPEIARVWYSEENFGRRDRAMELAARRGVGPLHVALAYVLAQPFQVVPIIGPRRLVELDDSLRALDVKLTPEEVRWLATGEGC